MNIFQLSEKKDEPNAGQVISFKQWSFVSFPDVDVIHIQYTDAKPMKSFAPMETSKSPSVKVCSLYS